MFRLHMSYTRLLCNPANIGIATRSTDSPYTKVSKTAICSKRLPLHYIMLNITEIVREAKHNIQSVIDQLKDPLIRKKIKRSMIYVLSWYISSLSLSVYNKWLFSKDHYNFQFPLFTTMIHTIIQFVLSTLSVILLFPKMKPKQLPKIKDYMVKVFPCGLATGMDIGLSNSSLKVILLN